MLTETFSESVGTIQDGAVNIPEPVQKALRVADGSKVLFIIDGEEVRIANPLIYAMREFQKTMEGEAERVGWHSDDDVVDMIMEMRRSRNEGLY